MSLRALLALSSALLMAPGAPAAVRSAACPAPAPAGLASPGRWYGSCPGGRAEGAGVLRTGAAEPFGLFAGRMSAGRPIAGIVIRPDGLFVPAAGFNAAGRPLPTDSLHPEQQHRLFTLAAQAAEATAARFAQAGNPSSARYYRSLAARIRNGEPE